MWFPWSDSIKTRLCRFLLHHYIGHFLEEKLSLEQMTVELYEGKGTIHNVALNTETLNELLDQLNLPFEITEGYIGQVSVGVPWSALVSSSTSVEVDGVEITIQPKSYCSTVHNSMMDSVRNMTSSLVLAQQVMEEELGDTKLEGLEAFARMIESVLSRVKCSFTNTAIRLQSRDPALGAVLELIIDRISYFDERETEETVLDDSAGYIPTAIAHKVILLSGISIRLSEFITTPVFSYFSNNEQEEDGTHTGLPEPIVMAKFLGEQEIKIHLKINDQLPGPKLDMECNVGSIHAMLSPHNVHVISDLIQDINATLSDNRKEAAPSRCKKMSSEDYVKVEQELHFNMRKQRQRDYSDGSDSEFFYSMTSGNMVPLAPLDLPPLDTELQSIPLSTLDKTHPLPHPHRMPQGTRKHDVIETPEDSIVLQLHVRYVAVTLLHQNLTSVSVSEDLSRPMTTLSAKYFNEVAEHVNNNYDNDASVIRQCLNKVCPHDHIFCVSVNTNLRLELITSTRQIDSSLSLTVLKCEVEECLYSSLTETHNTTPSIQPVLLLGQNETHGLTGSVYHATSPALDMVLKSHTTDEEYRTSCQLELGTVSIIIDITMVDRVGVLHKPKNSKHIHLPTAPGQDLHLPTASMVRQDIYEQVMVDEISGEQYKETFQFNAACSNVIITFRFPIPEMRPVSQRTWWAPSLRVDHVIAHITEINIDFNRTGDTSDLSLQFAKLNCDYLAHSDAEPISFLLAGQLPDTECKPKVTITISPIRESPLLVPHSPSPPPSLDNFLNIADKQPSPFAAKKVMYESQELVMPGSKVEMDAFEEETINSSRLSLAFSIPELLIYFQDKHFFEVLYNRIFTDLCLWTPGCPVIQETNLIFEPEIFKMCISTAHKESDSEEEDDDDLTQYRTSKRAKSDSWLSVSLDINQGRISLNSTVPPAPDQSPLHKNPTGEILVELIHTHVFLVSEYMGEPNTSFFSMYSDGGTLCHGTLSDLTMSSSTLTSTSIHTTLREILYTLPPHFATDLPASYQDYGFLSIAAKVFFDQAKNIKETTLAVALQNICHRYYMLPKEEHYALQLMEFFNVQDYSIPGYKLPLSVTALHTHLWNFAVDYRPVYLPWNMLLTVQSLGISSNIALDSSVTSLRVLLEDLSLYLAPSNTDGVLNKDYIRLVELDLFEFVIKMLLTPHERIPQLDIETKSNVLHVKTCGDSCVALRDLIVYCGSEGDLHGPGDVSPQELPRTTRIREYSSSDDVPSLVKSAVNTEDAKRAPSLDLNIGTRCEAGYSKHTFTFPDDSPLVKTVSDIALAAEDESEDVPITVHTPYDTASSLSAAMLSAMADEADEFFVVESDLVETMVAKGQFIIKKLVEGPHTVIEDHFTLPDDTDQLKAPPHFPVPLSRITVKEISIIWNIYGGNDFPEATPSNPGTPRSDRHSSDSSRERRQSRDYGGDAARKQTETGRNKADQMEFQITKMKLRVEQYPESATQNFRLCLILTDVEVKDKMGSSNFNKFMYQYSTEDNPRPSRTPMVCVKVVHNKSEESSEEAIIRVSVLPLRFNIDQDALIFIFSYFNSVSEYSGYKRPRTMSAGSSRVSPAAPSTTAPCSTEQSMSFGKSSAVVGKSSVCAVVEKSNSSGSSQPSSSLSQSQTDHELESSPVFIKAFVFSPEVPIRVDYKGKSIRGDTSLISNPVTNLLIGLAQLNCSELRLRSLCYRQGLLGYSRLLEWAVMQWVNDIKTSQLPSILGGVGPMHSFIQLFSGMVDLVYLPVQQYREDGRIVKGLQRGANSFTHSTAVSLLQLTSKLFSTIQCVAEVTYDLVSPVQHRKSSPSYHHPADLREGLVNAYEVVTADISSRANSIQHAAVYNHSTKGITSAIGGVLRELPPTLLLPFITLPKVITQLSNGAQNHLKPSTLKEREEKYRQS